MNLSVIICTWNRAELLDRTLTSMHELHIPDGISWELIVVNNNCTDNTDEVIQRHASKLPILRILEETPGQSHARNAALQAATGELLIWTDDDVVVAPDWIAQYLKAVRDWPEAAYFGGTVDPIYESPPPTWMEPHLKDLGAMLAIHQYGNHVSKFPEHDIPRGVNMALPKKILEEFEFDTRLGNSENSNLRGEDADLLRRLQSAGHYGVWVGPARVQHWVPTERLTKEYIQTWYRGGGRSFTLRNGLAECKWAFGYPRWVLKAFWISKLKAALTLPLRNKSWLSSFTRAAFLRGVLNQAKESGKVSLVQIAKNSKQ
ncbi:glycosyltransferase [Thalassoglobus polymorphus]|uniref:Putative glycosyl transferase n=1 Tax=Thalassoglobus polymorphus TaxID=2527994 RepID=A0A517QSP8_9PLAN|nr:glycosyltransferase [Thalassoglobus polymorphus]QDT34641.1 putative glycosyl transferase [Thalassoglobus polymorphus]